MTPGPGIELHHYIIERLSQAVDPDDLILELCDRHNLTWPEAEAMVARIRLEHQDLISRKQSPLLVALALALFLSGWVILWFEMNVIRLLVEAYIQARKQPPAILDLLSAAPNSLFLLVEGTPLAVAMILGSLLGMRKVWSSILFPKSSSD